MGKRSKLFCSAAIMTLMSGISYAQTSPTTATGDDEIARMDTVIVSSAKRDQPLQDVPLAVTALSEERLQQIGADTFEDYALSVPGLQLNDLGNNSSEVNIRGIASGISAGDLQDSVITLIDDIPSADTKASITQPDLRLFDVERVEVLRGPQGTLFGSGAMGGAIRIITNKPELDSLNGKIDLTASQVEGGELSTAYNGMVNIPIVENKLAIRAVGYYRDTGGWVDNIGLAGYPGGENVNSGTSFGGRFMVRYQPTDKLGILLNITHQNAEPDDSGYYNTTVNGELARATALAEYSTDKFTLVNLVADYDFGFATLTSSTTYYDRDAFRTSDYTVYSTYFSPTVELTPFVGTVKSENYFEELRLASNGDERFDWLVGFYYRNQAGRDIKNEIILPGSEALYGPSPEFGAPNDVPYDFLLSNETKEMALFGEVNYEITEKLEATFGARLFRHEVVETGYSQGVWYGTRGRADVDVDAEDEAATFKGALKYNFSDDQMVYGLISQGYRVGGTNLPRVDPTPDSFGPDELTMYEIGSKSTFADGRFTLNAALFYIDWTDMQVGLYTANNNDYYIANAGAAHSQGVEFEVQAQLTENLSWTGSAALTQAEIDVDNTALGASAGDRVPGTPELTTSNLLRYDFELYNGVDAFVQGSHQYVDKSYTIFNQASPSAYEMGDYHMVNARIGADFGKWELALFANNLLDEDKAATAFSASAVYPVRPRTIGVTLRADFES